MYSIKRVPIHAIYEIWDQTRGCPKLYELLVFGLECKEKSNFSRPRKRKNNFKIWCC